MDNVVTLFEYESKEFDISNRDSYKDGKLILTDKTIEELKKFSERNVIELKWKVIKALNYVGVIKVGDITIEIYPKFLKEGNEEKLKEIASKNLLKMLEYTQKWKFKEIDYASLEKVEHSFFEILIYLFAKNLLFLLKVKQNFEYIRKRENLRFVKGRIDFNKYTNPARFHIIPCIHYERQMDNLLNRTLKYTSYLMSKIVKNKDTYRMLCKIINLLEPVTLTPVTIQQVKSLTFNRLNADFKPFIEICRTFLENSTLTLQSSKIETFLLLIPMEYLFEQFIVSVIQQEGLHKEVFGNNARLEVQKSIGHLIEKDKKRMAEMRPDIIIKAGKEIIIIDIKYKLLNPEDTKLGISQQDLYQMYTYCREINAQKALLLYLGELNEITNIETPFKVGKEKDIELYVRTVPLNLDLVNEYGKFVEKLRLILYDIKAELK